MENKKMNYEAYFEERLKDQIDWYEKKSKRNKNCYLILSIIEIVAASSIPFLVSYTDKYCEFKIVVGVLGVLIAIITGAVVLFKCQELWVEYRVTGEQLKHQRYLFETGTKPYDGDDAFHILVENVENIISKERSKWSQYTSERKKEKVKK